MIKQKYSDMNQEKVITQMSNSAGEYLAPSIKVVEMKTKRMICQISNGGLGDIKKQDGTW